MGLNQETNNEAYVLGRIFSVIEDIQKTAKPKIVSNIADQCFSTACMKPLSVFPFIINQSSLWMREIGYKKPETKEIYKEILINLYAKLTGGTELTYPKTLRIEEQGTFQFGYFHQKNEMAQYF
ncbi:type I-C CRISPR-associated protein Cas8c/Csd1 [Eubacterium sp.]|uniref:type I-C CRISPR-associated protein Cas8c/Csd1 n=1 Tax=Eubacterium sp. TaxID=142586 RepID=UPI002FC88863